MTPPNPLTVLAERVSALTEACRETDGLIYQSIDPVIVQCWPHWNRAQLETIVPRYTASLDAAMTLARNNREAMTMIYVAHKSFEAAEMDDAPNLFPRIKAMLACNLRARAASESSHG
jgi:hypothetical protein